MSASPGRPRILIAEDDDASRTVIVAALAGRYNVATAHDGREALRQATLDPPQLLITDMMMPRMDGMMLLDALRHEPSTAAVPVIVLTAKSGSEDYQAGLDAGVANYLAKPLTTAHLLEAVEAALHGTA